MNQEFLKWETKLNDLIEKDNKWENSVKIINY